MTKTEMRAKIRKESGIRFQKETLSISQWVNWLKSHSDTAVQNIGYGIEFGVKTGRIPNWIKINSWDKILTINHQPMTNGQMADVIAAAIVEQSDLSTAAAVKALQAVMDRYD